MGPQSNAGVHTHEIKTLCPLQPRVQHHGFLHAFTNISFPARTKTYYIQSTNNTVTRFCIGENWGPQVATHWLLPLSTSGLDACQILQNCGLKHMYHLSKKTILAEVARYPAHQLKSESMKMDKDLIWRTNRRLITLEK